MSNLKAVEAEVENLSLRELAEFRAWFLNYDADLSDKEVEADYRSGKLDALISEAVQDYQQGKATELVRSTLSGKTHQR